MNYLFGFIFLLLSIWQFFAFRRAFTYLKEEGNEDTSPFILLALWTGLAVCIGFFTVSMQYFFVA